MPSRYYACPVCQFPELISSPCSDRGLANFDICPCCGVEFGYDDASTTYAELRARWVAGGMKWWSQAQTPPDGWSPESQIGKGDSN
jgi:hypothetical protein